MFCFPNFCRKNNKMVTIILQYWLHSRHFASIKPGLVPETHISLHFYPPSMPSNPPTCWRTIDFCRKKEVNEIWRVLAPQYQTETTHSAVLYILPTFQRQSHAMSTLQSSPVEWLHFGTGTGHLTAQTKPDLLTSTPLCKHNSVQDKNSLQSEFAMSLPRNNATSSIKKK